MNFIGVDEAVGDPMPRRMTGARLLSLEETPPLPTATSTRTPMPIRSVAKVANIPSPLAITTRLNLSANHFGSASLSS